MQKFQITTRYYIVFPHQFLVVYWQLSSVWITQNNILYPPLKSLIIQIGGSEGKKIGATFLWTSFWSVSSASNKFPPKRWANIEPVFTRVTWTSVACACGLGLISFFFIYFFYWDLFQNLPTPFIEAPVHGQIEADNLTKATSSVYVSHLKIPIIYQQNEQQMEVTKNVEGLRFQDQ